MKDSPQGWHAPFEVLKLGADGSEQRVSEAKSFDGAMFCVELAAARLPGRYVIHNHSTGEREVLNFEPKSWQRGA